MGCCDWMSKLDSMNLSAVEVNKLQGSFSFRRMLAFIGPGFLVAIAYIDPGNLEADINAGSQFAYELVWVLFASTIMGMVIQYMAAKLGIVAQRDLAQQCKYSYSRPLRIFLWLMAEIAVIASDIPEVLGTAYALNLLFGIPVVLGILITTLDTFLFLFLQYASIRLLEAVIGFFMFTISGCFIIELFLADVDWLAMIEGFVPFYIPAEFQGKGGSYTEYIGASIGLLGAVIMPHNLFFHSALVKTRKIERTESAIKESMLYNGIECFLALMVSFLINYALISLSASTFFYDPNSGLQEASVLLNDLLGKFSEIVFGIALLASGQSSTITGTFAGQFIMEGFLDINIVPWKRNLITRSIAILPSLFICIFAGPEASNNLILLANVILSVQLPFALIPLLKMTSNSKIMTDRFKNGKLLKYLSIVISIIIIVANMSLLAMIFISHIDLTIWYYWLILGVGLIFAILYISMMIVLLWIRVDDFEIDIPSIQSKSEENISKVELDSSVQINDLVYNNNNTKMSINCDADFVDMNNNVNDVV